MRKLTKLIGPLLAVMLIAAACSDDDSADTSAPEATSPPATEAPTTEAPTTEAPAAMDIVDTAVAAGDFTTLVAAVEAAGLVDTLKGEGPFTVFAPTDAAFAALPEGTVEALLEDIPALTEILLYHVVAGRVPAADVVGLTKATTVQGSDVAVTVNGASVMLNTSNVTVTDIETSNGIIHVIDAVLIPGAEEVMEDEVAAGDGVGDRLRMGDVSPHLLGAELHKVGIVASRQSANLIAARAQCLDQAAPNESSASGDQYSHCTLCCAHVASFSRKIFEL